MKAARPRVAAAAALLLGACIQVHAHGDEAAAAARIPERAALLQRAQAELERGDASTALDDFERAAMMLHAADAELGLIRAAMQDGQYRRALAFCAHTAGEHTDDTEGGALYAWLLRVGGQPAQSDRVLADLHAAVPADALVVALEAAFAVDPPVAVGPLRESAHRMAPWPVARDGQAPPPAAARFAGNAVLEDGGATALVPASALGAATSARLWVRNGLGESSAATLDRDDPALASRGLARLRLRATLSPGATPASSGRAPFAGTPGYTVQFGGGSEPAWPMLAQGFLGNVVGDTGSRRLGFASAPGAPVLDARGALVGITNAQATWLPLAAFVPPSATAATAPAGLALSAPDAVYEAGLRRALQVLVDSPH